MILKVYLDEVASREIKTLWAKNIDISKLVSNMIKAYTQIIK